MSNIGNRFKLDSLIFGVPALLDFGGGSIFFFDCQDDAEGALKYAKEHLSEKENINEADFPDSFNFK